MIRTDGMDSRPPLPPILDLPGVDEGPMRRDLKRQIQQLEHEIASFHVENCPYEAFEASPVRGPAVLTNEQLEQVRDELTEVRAELHERVTQRAVDQLALDTERHPEAVGVIERLNRRLRGQA